MAYIIADRVKETSISIGTGTIALGGASTGYRRFADVMTVGDTCPYVIALNTEWEVGIATYSAANILTRTTIHSSSNAGSAVNFTAGTKDVFLGPTAETVPEFNPITNTITSGVWGGSTIPVLKGGTGSTTASGARTNLSLVIGTDVLAPNGSAASLTNFPTLNQNTTGTAANVTGIVAVANGGTGVTTSTGTGSVVLSNTPTLITPQTNAINAVPVVSGAGNNLTLTAGSGVGTGAGGNIILQPGAQGSSGGNGTIILKNVDGVEFGRFYKVSGGGFGITATGNRFDFLANTTAYGLGVSGGGFCRISATSTEVEMNVGSWQGNTRSIALPSGRGIGWSNSSTLSTYDLGMERATLGVLAITTNSSTTVGSSAGGSLSFPSTTTAFSANTNDLALTASGFQRINCTSAASLTGIASPSGGTHVNGRMVRVYNVGTANLTLAHNSASSTAANRFWNSTGADIVLSTHQYVELIYDSTDNGRGGAGWRVSSVH